MIECIITDAELIRSHKNLMQADLERVLFDEATILRRLDEIAAQISNDYRDRELTVIAVLNGSIIFMADLLRRIPLPLKLDCLSVASYHGGTKSSEKGFSSKCNACPTSHGPHPPFSSSTTFSIGGRLFRNKHQIARN